MSNEEKIFEIIADISGLEPYEMTKDSTMEDLGLDSLDGIEVVMAIEKEFTINIPDTTVQNFKKIEDLINYVNDKL
jgi:acyl carrier protein